MMNGLLLFRTALLLAVEPQARAAGTDSSCSPVSFWVLFHHIDANLGGSFTLDDGAYHLAAIPATDLIIRSGADWKWNTYTNNRGVASHGFTSAEAATLLPVALPLSLYLFGWSRKNDRLQITGLAPGQAALLSVGISAAYKVFTGRRPPQRRRCSEGEFRL